MKENDEYAAKVNLQTDQSVNYPRTENKMRDHVTVVCMRWGNPFSKDYVKVLYQGVKRNLSCDFDFVCLSDDLEPICDGVCVLPIPELKMSREKWAVGFWPKLTVFKPGLFPPNQPVLFLDLDVLILSSLDPFIELLQKKRGLHMLREWNPALWSLVPVRFRPDRGGQSSLFAFYPEEQTGIYDQFMKEDAAGAFTTAHNDQSFISKTCHRLSYLPHNWAVSFKKHCVRYYPFNLIFKKIGKPKKAKVVVFHGCPKPTDLIRDDHTRWGTRRKFGHGPVDWVKSYWEVGLHAAGPKRVAGV